MSDIEKTPESEPEPAQLRFLRILVTVLTGVMILGLLTIIGLFVMRFRADLSPTPGPTLPESIALPDNARPKAVTLGEGWIAVVTDADDILIFDAEGTLIQQVEITPLENKP